MLVRDDRVTSPGRGALSAPITRTSGRRRDKLCFSKTIEEAPCADRGRACLRSWAIRQRRPSAERAIPVGGPALEGQASHKYHVGLSTRFTCSPTVGGGGPTKFSPAVCTRQARVLRTPPSGNGAFTCTYRTAARHAAGSCHHGPWLVSGQPARKRDESVNASRKSRRQTTTHRPLRTRNGHWLV